MALIQTLKRYLVTTYFVLTFVLSWAFFTPEAIAHDTTSFPFIVFVALGNITPSLVGIFLTALFSGKSGLGELFRRLGQVRVPLIWYAVVVLIPLVLWLVPLGVMTLLGLATITFAFSVVGVLGAFVVGLGEELGWRGFALPRLQARQSALSASLLIGVLWGLWHIPTNIALGRLSLTATDLLQFLFIVVYLMALSVLFTWVYNNTSGSLFMVVLFHTVLAIVNNNIPATSNTLIFFALLAILTWIVAAIIVVRAGAARLSRSSDVTPA